ncbi:MAG: transposase, partial [Magnetospiraceae bacterium]
MAHPMGESETGVLRLDFDRRLKLEFHGSKVTSDAGLLPFRELDDALGLTELAGGTLVDPRTGKNGQHDMTGLFRQSTFGRLGGYEDVNDADRLGRDPAMRWIVGGNAVAKQAASASQMGRFETE